MENLKPGLIAELIAQAFQSVRYLILPNHRLIRLASGEARQEILRIRHHSLFAPRDFDPSPYFRIMKPHLKNEFDHRVLEWAEGPLHPPAAST
jgi:hypothetical protein